MRALVRDRYTGAVTSQPGQVTSSYILHQLKQPQCNSAQSFVLLIFADVHNAHP